MPFRTPTGLQRTLVALLVLDVALGGLLAAGMGLFLWTTRSGFNLSLIAALTMAIQPFLLLSFVGFIVLLVWLSYIARNARALAPGDTVPTPGWVVGHYFIPLLNLYLPLRDMRQLWRASNPTSSGSGDCTAARGAILHHRLVGSLTCSLDCCCE